MMRRESVAAGASKSFSEEGNCTLVFTGAKKSSVRLRRKLINFLILEKYPEITEELSKHTSQEITSFFIEEGCALFRHSMLDTSIRPLDFILEKIPPEAIKQVFNSHKTDFLGNLLYTQKMAEMRGENSQAKRDLMVEKFIRLLQIEPDGVQELMKDFILNVDYMVPSIAEDYRVALECFQESRKQSLKY